MDFSNSVKPGRQRNALARCEVKTQPPNSLLKIPSLHDGHLLVAFSGLEKPELLIFQKLEIHFYMRNTLVSKSSHMLHNTLVNNVRLCHLVMSQPL
jgi:hypothetical protein